MAGRKIIWSYKAKTDQSKILEYFQIRNGNKKYSKKLYNRFKNATNLISHHPDIGIKTDINNVRNIIEGDYAIFYRFNEEYIEIITTWDCRQNPESLRIS